MNIIVVTWQLVVKESISQTMITNLINHALPISLLLIILVNTKH